MRVQRGTLRVTRAETWLTVYRTLPYGNSWIRKRIVSAKNGITLPKIGRVDKVLLDDLQEIPKKTLSSVCRI